MGPVSIGLVNGSLYRGGEAPPLEPGKALHAVEALIEGDMIPDGDLGRLIGLPSLPAGGTVQGDIEGLYAGRRALLSQSCRITREQVRARQVLVITGTPPGVAVDEIGRNLGEKGLNPLNVLASPTGLVDVRDETSGRTGTRIVLVVTADADLMPWSAGYEGSGRSPLRPPVAFGAGSARCGADGHSTVVSTGLDSTR